MQGPLYTQPLISPVRVYLHTPWCRTICPYCGFHVLATGRTPPDGEDFAAAVALEFSLWKERIEQPLPALRSLYLGGGSPSLLPDATIRSLTGFFVCDDGCEVTIEANPGQVHKSRYHHWQAAGINRVSLGVQSFDPQVRKALGRASETAALFEATRVTAEFWENWNLDLVYGHKSESDASWQRTLHYAEALDPPHVSLYALTIEDNTPFARLQKRDTAVAADDDSLATRWHMARDLLSVQPYEISNFSRPGFEAGHNSAYWQGQDWLALGPGATGTLFSGQGANRSIWRYRNLPYDAWRATLRTRSLPVEEFCRVSDEELRIESIAAGLRCSWGVSVSDIDLTKVNAWIEKGVGEIRRDRFHLNPDQWLLADAYALSLI